MEIKVGTRVQIVKAEGLGLKLPLRDPHPEHIGKKGVIAGVDESDGMPKIQLDDGTTLFGYECWWEPIVRRGGP